MSEEQVTEELVSSEMGMKEYWNEAYLIEKKNFSDYGDVGEIWFGEDSGLRIVRWLCSSALVKKDDRIIDLGCGNGMLLVEMAREGFINLTGVDYSQNAIDLAESIMKKQNVTIGYEVCNFLSLDGSAMSREYAIVLDKGTYDAVSLHPHDSKGKREKYILNVWKLLKPQGLFVITSCNWTEKELISHFGAQFCLFDVIPSPTFKFGDKTGNLFTSLVLLKK
ncbi:EEF1A lysine methyltransferase 2 [Zootermopsis nevadensis]|uniref:Protein-lysine N-methyltransferase L798_03561 n=1 Tax=Zootermopsis nevadensis TaxID=136037 RepID=A0A067QSZ5_ZOONE|nr:EEF1A lysine methyltransferase 2 [Zootermopsis nevadensis]XP_021941309.1 EEF1A lysine methyltransferase 2 [Zootermopsis nevadensis]KDR06587.1 Methyltransferase-like protein 10 [Zootermopsis nevadensis]